MLNNEIYEEYFLNASISTFSINIGGFISKCGGIDISSNCVFPIYEKNDSQIDKKISEIENFLLEKDIVPIYRIVYQDNYQKLDRVLFNKHYEKVANNIVLACPLQGKKNELFKFADFNESGIYIDTEITGGDGFLEDYFYLRKISKNDQIIFNTAIDICPLKKYSASLLEEGHLIGQAYFIRQGDVVIIKDIVISTKYRGLGYSSKILYSILTYCLKNGAELVIAEIPTDNENVMNLFGNNPMFFKLYDIFYRQLIKNTKGRFIFD